MLRRLALALVGLALATCHAVPALADCDPGAGWAAGTACTPASRIGVRLGSTDQSLQAAINAGTIGRGLAPRTVTSTATLAAGDLAQVNTTSGAFAVTLPAGPSDGSVIEIVDAAGTFDTNGLTINRGGADTIEGATSKVISTEYAYVRLSYDSGLARWQMLDEAGGGGSGDVQQVWTAASGDVSGLVAGAGDTFDAGAASASSPATSSFTLPATCAINQLHQDKDSGGSTLFICTAPNTWSKLALLSEAGGVSDGDKTDITITVGGTVYTIDPGAVTSGKLANDAVSDSSKVAAGAIERTDHATSAVGAAALDEADVEAGLEAVLDLQDQQGAVTDAQVPNGITVDTADEAGRGTFSIRLDQTEGCAYLDYNGNNSRDFNAAEQCIDGTSGDSGGAPHDGRLNWCSPIAYERNGTTTTEGIQECIDYLGALGGGTLLLGPRGYFPTGPIVIDEGGAGEIRIQGSGIGATFIQCLAGPCSANVAIAVLDNDVTLSDFSVIHTVATRTAAIQLGDVSNYVSGVTLRRLKIDGASGEVAGSRVGNGIHLRSLENRLEDIQLRWFSNAVKLEATTTGGVNANTFDGIDVSSADKCIDTNVGGDIANEGDSHQLWLSHVKCQTINGAAITVRGGNSNPANYNSVVVRESHLESTSVGISILGGSGTRDPNVYAIGLTCADTASCVTADASSNSTIIVESSSLDSDDCITHNGTGYVYTHALYATASPCTPTVNGTTSFWRSIDSDIAWRDEAVAITGAWDLGGASLEIPNSTTLPATCTVGQQYMDIDATSGQRHYLCESTNTWVLQGGGGGSGDALEVENGDNTGAFDAITTTGQLEDSGDINFERAGAGAPHQITGTVRANSVELTTDTTGSYAAGDAEAGNALTGDSATAFFTSGQIELARGGTGTDTSAFGGSIFGLISGSFTDIDTWAEIASAIGVSNTALDASGNLTVRTLITADLDGSNFIDLFDNATGTPSCASLITAGKVGLLDSDASAARAWDLCDGTSLLWRFPATSTTTTHALMATSTAGAPAFRALVRGDLSDLGTGVATALGVNVGSAGAFVTFNGALGTPSSGTLTNATGLPISTGVSGLGSGVATFLGTPSSANLASALTGETGSGAAVFGTNPTVDFTGGTLRLPNSTTLPGTCTVGDIYFDTDATSGQRIYACQATNTWALQGDGGGGGGTSVVLDTGDDAANESTAITELATTGDAAGTDAIVDEPSADKTLFHMDRLWPGGTDLLYVSNASTNPYVSYLSGSIRFDADQDGDIDLTITTGTGALANNGSVLPISDQLGLLAATSPTPTVEGATQWDSDDDKLVIGDGAGQKIIVPTASVSGDGTMTTAGVLEVTQADALEANGTNCGAGEAAQGIDTAGNAEGCFTPGGGSFGYAEAAAAALAGF